MTANPGLKKQIADYTRALHDRGWVANHDGNVSARTGAGFLVSPTAISKRMVGPDDLVTCDAEGRPVSRGKPPSEVAMHVAALKARPDVQAVIHAHPPHASAFALARIPVEPIAMPEVVVSLGERVPLLPLLMPKDERLGPAIAEAAAVADVMLLSGNGVLAFGVDLEQAYLRVELIEHYARILSLAKALGGPAALSRAELDALLQQRRAAGLGPKGDAKPSDRPADAKDQVRDVVAEEVKRALGGGSR